MKRKIWSLLICIMLLCMGGCSAMVEDIKNDLEWTKENQIAGEHYNEAVVDALLEVFGVNLKPHNPCLKRIKTRRAVLVNGRK